MLAVVTKFLLIALFFYRCSADLDVGLFNPRYHLFPKIGWMNDPNGFCKFQNEYHLFYQYNPYSSQEAGIANWGHAKSCDLMHWEDLPIAMKPDQPYDKTGVFSGSAIVENGTMHLLYTGNVNTAGGPDNMQFQALATSTDGINVTKYAGNPVIIAEEHQPNIRDPKVWKHEDLYYMVLGNSFNNNTLGRILLYVSEDLYSWKQATVLFESDGPLGYMWECPDFFELGGFHILLMSPQGINATGDLYKNLYQTGYLVGDFDYKTLSFVPITKFRELDFGHDFYATQTMLDVKTKNRKEGSDRKEEEEEEEYRRIMIAWCDMWEQEYPERDHGYTGQMTIPRELFLSKELRLIQKPVKEINFARGFTLYSGKAQGGQTVQLEDNAAEIKITARKSKNFELFIESTNVSVSISYDSQKGKVTLDRGGEDGIRRTNWRAVGKLKLYILVDSSSIELFWGDGEVTFSSRFFPYGDVKVRLGYHSQAENLTVSTMKRTVERPDCNN